MSKSSIYQVVNCIIQVGTVYALSIIYYTQLGFFPTASIPNILNIMHQVTEDSKKHPPMYAWLLMHMQTHTHTHAHTS